MSFELNGKQATEENSKKHIIIVYAHVHTHAHKPLCRTFAAACTW